MSAPVRRLRACVENWPEAETGAYDPHCCRFPKSCSATVYDEGQVAEEDLEPRGAAPLAPLARVGDVIAHGETIPANVRRVRDRARDLWGRFDEGWLLTSYKGEPCDATGSPLYPDLLSAQWGPLEVVEVDPEAQPAEPVDVVKASQRAMLDQIADLLDVGAYDDLVDEVKRRLAIITGERSGPVVLSLPQVPDGAVALIGGMTGARYTLMPASRQWMHETNALKPVGFADLLVREGSVTVEVAPPREPRTWPRLDLGVTGADLPAAIDLYRDGEKASPHRWVLNESGRTYERPGLPETVVLTLTELATLGEVREVLT